MPSGCFVSSLGYVSGRTLAYTCVMGCVASTRRTMRPESPLGVNATRKSSEPSHASTPAGCVNQQLRTKWLDLGSCMRNCTLWPGSMRNEAT